MPSTEHTSNVGISVRTLAPTGERQRDANIGGSAGRRELERSNARCYVACPTPAVIITLAPGSRRRVGLYIYAEVCRRKEGTPLKFSKKASFFARGRHVRLAEPKSPGKKSSLSPESSQKPMSTRVPTGISVSKTVVLDTPKTPQLTPLFALHAMKLRIRF
jgi:hypothetical protein